ncbi:MAG TPA: BTAD domain-containing putative transcriptional regulator, partial [Gemmatimonadales bacterium]|nr:BTAD domain-containing putative transcriptional regulator [Gemmatimonadales bacterium]
MALQVNVLGGLATVRDGVRLEGAAAQPRRLALLALLVVAGPRGLGRDKIIALLWPEADEERARKNVAQAIYALRQVMGEDALLVGTWDVRLNPELVTSDFTRFEMARQSGAMEQAAAAYTGPFLDGFHLTGAIEFDRWVEEQRALLQHSLADVLEQLAREAEDRNDFRGAAAWWRRRGNLDPHDGRIAAALIGNLAAAGDPGAALQHGRSFQTSLAEELHLPPDRQVERILGELQASRRPPAPASLPPAPAAGLPGPRVPSAEPVPHSSPASRTWRSGWVLASIGILGLVVSGLVLRRAAADRSPPTLSIGPLADHRPAPGDDLRGPLRDLLATSLGRSPTVRVVSTARMYELLGDRAPESDLPLSTWAEEAREAGASEVVDGALYALPDGRLQLDLRRLDLRNGRVLGTARAQATDAFALADSATALLLAGMGVEQPRGSIASLTTGSLVAYRLYEQGLRRYIRRDYTSALHLLLEALREDSSFAMAALYAAKATRDFQERLAFMRQAFHLADRATERERLLIRAQAAILMSDPALNGYIDSLVTRFPGEVEGYLFAGIARAGAGQYLSALPYLERVVALDSGAANLGTGECRICEALSYITGAYHSLDSMAAAETHARRTTRLVPEYANGWATLSEILSIRGRYQESEDAAVAFDRLAPGINLALRARSHNLIRSGRAGEAASLMTGEAAIASGERRLEALWFAVIALREAGRGDEALELALQLRREFTSPAGIAGSSSPMMHAAALEAGGDPRAAAALFDSIAREPVRGDIPSHAARTRAWAWTQAASALAAAGD